MWMFLFLNEQVLALNWCYVIPPNFKKNLKSCFSCFSWSTTNLFFLKYYKLLSARSIKITTCECWWDDPVRVITNNKYLRTIVKLTKNGSKNTTNKKLPSTSNTSDVSTNNKLARQIATEEEMLKRVVSLKKKAEKLQSELYVTKNVNTLLNNEIDHLQHYQKLHGILSHQWITYFTKWDQQSSHWKRGKSWQKTFSLIWKK